MSVVRTGETQNITIQRRSVQRIAVNARVKATTGAGFPDLKKVICKLTLVRNGRSYTLFSDNLAVLARLSMYYENYEVTSASRYAYLIATNVYLYPMLINLGSPINLMGDDSLQLEVSALNGWEGTSGTPSSSESFIDVEFRNTIGVERAIPVIRSKTIQASTGKEQLSLGDNVTQIAILHLGAPVTPNDLNGICTGINITSDKYDVGDNMDRMLGRRASQFQSFTDAALRYSSFLYQPESEIDSVQVDVMFNSANVTASDNVIVWRSFIMDRFTMDRGNQMEQKHDRRNAEKFLKHFNGQQASN